SSLPALPAWGPSYEFSGSDRPSLDGRDHGGNTQGVAGQHQSANPVEVPVRFPWRSWRRPDPGWERARSPMVRRSGLDRELQADCTRNGADRTCGRLRGEVSMISILKQWR